MIKKLVLLFLALLLPVSIFLFLHFFGQNEFDIPIYYQSRSPEIPTECQIDYQFPYKVKSIRIPIQGPSVIFFTSGLSSGEIKDSNFQLDRIATEFEARAPEVILVSMNSDSVSMNELSEVLILEDDNYGEEQRCIFLSNGNHIVLVDAEQQIRGLYPNANLKEVDRLILELKILFKEY